MILLQDTQGMIGEDYERPPFPSTWARQHGKGRVFYTSMGHREDVWTSPTFQQILLGGLGWATGNTEFALAGNVEQTAPGARIETYEDHRIAMSFALAGLKIGGITILDPDCVGKTYPGYWEALRGLGVEFKQ